MKHAAKQVLLLVAMASFAVADGKPISPPQFIPVQFGAGPIFVTGINNSGIMVGYYNVSAQHGFAIIGQRKVNIDVPPAMGTDTNCWGINSAGVIVGTYSKNEDVSAFVYQNGEFTQLRPNGDFAAAYGINDLGMIVGTYSADQKHNDGFMWDGTTYQRLDVPGATDTLARGINNQGVIVLQWYDSSGHVNSSLYDGSAYTNVDIPDATETFAYGINNNGDISASWNDAEGHTHAAIFHAGQWRKFMVPGSNFTDAFGINDQAVTVGASRKHDSGNYTGYKLIP